MIILMLFIDNFINFFVSLQEKVKELWSILI